MIFVPRTKDSIEVLQKEENLSKIDSVIKLETIVSLVNVLKTYNTYEKTEKSLFFYKMVETLFCEGKYRFNKRGEIKFKLESESQESFDGYAFSFILTKDKVRGFLVISDDWRTNEKVDEIIVLKDEAYYNIKYDSNTIIKTNKNKPVFDYSTHIRKSNEKELLEFLLSELANGSPHN